MLKPGYNVMVKISTQIPEAILHIGEDYVNEFNAKNEDKANIEHLWQNIIVDWAEKQSKSPAQASETETRRGRKPKANQGEHLQVVSQSA